jgi:hypothetical protein
MDESEREASPRHHRNRSGAQNDAGGRILRLVAPTERQANDNDLRRFQAGAKKQYAAWLASLDPHQTRTDILGTLDVVQQEFAAVPRGADSRLIILTERFYRGRSPVSLRFLAAACERRAFSRNCRRHADGSEIRASGCASVSRAVGVERFRSPLIATQGSSASFLGGVSERSGPSACGAL